MITLQFSQTYTLSEFAFTDGVADILSQDGVLHAVSRHGLTALSISDTGDVTLVDERAFDMAFAPGAEPVLAQWPGAGGDTLLIGGQGPAGLRALALDPDGGFGTAVDLGGEPGVLSAPQVVGQGGGQFLISGLHNADGLRVYDLPALGPPTLVSQLADSDDLPLADVSATAVFTTGVPFLLSASATEDRIGAFRVNPDGSLTPTDAFGASEGLGIDAPTKLIAVTTGGEAFAVAGGQGSSSLSVLRVSGDGSLSYADHIVDSLGTRFQSVGALDALEVSGRVFIVAGGADDGVSLFTLAPNGRLIHLQSLANGAGMTLDGVSAVSLAAAGTTLQILAAGSSTPGITRLSSDLSDLGQTLVADTVGEAVAGGALDDLLVGGAGDDLLSGLAGDDILIDGGGQDVLTGGDGADLFVLEADGLSDRITDFEVGVDKLDLSSFGLLYSPDQLSITATDDGAVIRFHGEEIVLTTSDGTALSTGDLTVADILNADRPPYLPTPDALEGTDEADTLTGGLADDVIVGLGGADLLDGGAGNDVIVAGPGDDTATGGPGDDWIAGGTGDDWLEGGDGNDWISGGDRGPSGPLPFDWYDFDTRLRAVTDLQVKDVDSDPSPDFLF